MQAPQAHEAEPRAARPSKRRQQAERRRQQPRPRQASREDLARHACLPFRVSVHGDCPGFRGLSRENGTVPLVLKGTGTPIAKAATTRWPARTRPRRLARFSIPAPPRRLHVRPGNQHAQKVEGQSHDPRPGPSRERHHRQHRAEQQNVLQRRRPRSAGTQPARPSTWPHRTTPHGGGPRVWCPSSFHRGWPPREDLHDPRTRSIRRRPGQDHQE